MNSLSQIMWGIDVLETSNMILSCQKRSLWWSTACQE